MYRKSDLKVLEDIFARPSNDIVVIYGDCYSDLKDLIKNFIKNKDSFYYNAVCVTDDTQMALFAGQMSCEYKNSFIGTPYYDSVLSPFLNKKTGRKKVLVINDFQFLLQYNPTYINYLSGQFLGNTSNGEILIILASEDIHFVTKEMTKLVGKKSYEISASLKIRGLTYKERFENLKNIDDEYDRVVMSVLLGGNELFFNHSYAGNVKKNLTDILLDNDGTYVNSLMRYLPQDIRQPALYNSILFCLSKGINKLNDLHLFLKTERSKILIYLNTLIEFGIVEKCDSIIAGEKDETLKGNYRIVNSAVSFYYRFIFPNASARFVYDNDAFYKKMIEPGINSFVEEYFPEICMEYIILLEQSGRLSFEIEDMGEYLDKSGAIDFVIKVKGGNVICCGTHFDGMFMSYQKLADIKTSIKKYKIDCDNIWLFSMEGFDQKLTMTAEVNPMIKLIGKNNLKEVIVR